MMPQPHPQKDKANFDPAWIRPQHANASRRTKLNLWTVLAVLLVVNWIPADAGQMAGRDKSVVVADFESAREVARWTGLKVEQTTAHASSGRFGLRFDIPKWSEGKEERPGIRLSVRRGRKPADWSRYGKITVDAWVEGSQPGRLGLKLRDAQGQSSWTTHITVEPGKRNRIELLMDDVAADCDVHRIAEAVLYSLRPTNSFSLVVDNLRLWPSDKPPLAVFHLAYPNYRGLIFPEADEVKAGVVVACKEHGLKPRRLALVLSLRAGDKVVSTRQTLRQKELQLSLATTSFAAGAITLKASLVEARSGKELASEEWPLRKLTAKEVGKLKVYVDHNNNLVADGKPFFPLGWYGSVNDQHLAELADSPFNCLLAYGTDSVPKERMLRFLDAMQQYGLKLVYCLNDVYPTATYLSGKNWEGIQGNDAIAKAIVTAYRNHPAILAWYLNDELPRTLLPQLTDYYHRVREADPQHPTFIVLCNRRDFRIFPSTTDILGVDPYPIPHDPITLVSGFMDTANAAVRGSQPVWLVPQAFAWYQYNSKNPDRGHLPTPEELKKGRAPTYAEERCMTYLGLTHGAKGLIYYCYYDLRVLPQYREMWAGMKKIAAEVKSLTPVLLSPDDPSPVKVSPKRAPLHTKLKRVGNQLYLLAVNSGDTPVNVKMKFSQPLEGPVNVLFENRQLPSAGRHFKDRFEPLEAHVYELSQKSESTR
jgi:hypothetical protein